MALRAIKSDEKLECTAPSQSRLGRRAGETFPSRDRKEAVLAMGFDVFFNGG